MDQEIGNWSGQAGGEEGRRCYDSDTEYHICANRISGSCGLREDLYWREPTLYCRWYVDLGVPFAKITQAVRSHGETLTYHRALLDG